MSLQRSDANVPDLFRTATGSRLHIRPCPHVHGVELFAAGSADRESHEVCGWCQAEIDGAGRTYFDTLDNALRAFGSHVETLDAIRSEVAAVVHDAIWIPNSRSYVALGSGGPAVCWIGKTYLMHVDGAFVELPGYGPGVAGGTTSPLREGEVCGTCFLRMPVTGRCDNCS